MDMSHRNVIDSLCIYNCRPNYFGVFSCLSHLFIIHVSMKLKTFCTLPAGMRVSQKQWQWWSIRVQYS